MPHKNNMSYRVAVDHTFPLVFIHRREAHNFYQQLTVHPFSPIIGFWSQVTPRSKYDIPTIVWFLKSRPLIFVHPPALFHATENHGSSHNEIQRCAFLGCIPQILFVNHNLSFEHLYLEGIWFNIPLHQMDVEWYPLCIPQNKPW